MIQESYLSWLSDRGLKTPVGQSFIVVDGFMDPASDLVIIAEVDPEDLSQIASLRKLAVALSEVNGASSWVAITRNHGDSFVDTNLSALRNIMPNLSKVLHLAEEPIPEQLADSFKLTTSLVALRPLARVRAPRLSLLNANSELKRFFWGSAKSWLSAPD